EEQEPEREPIARAEPWVDHHLTFVAAVDQSVVVPGVVRAHPDGHPRQDHQHGHPDSEPPSHRDLLPSALAGLVPSPSMLPCRCEGTVKEPGRSRGEGYRADSAEPTAAAAVA